MKSEININDALKLSDWIIDLRQSIHSHPELSFNEIETAKLISIKLKECGLDVVERISDTGVVGLLKGNQAGQTVALRADTDALPIMEANTLPYKSIFENCMHACGHDGHTAMLLGAARLLSTLKESIKGNIKFIFQPAEELPPVGGAKRMISAGVLEDPHVDAIFGLHIWPDLPSESIGVKPGPIMAAPDRIKLIIKGKGGHAAAPHQSADIVVTAAQVILGLQTIVSRHIDPLTPVVLSICQISGGLGYNILPDEVTLEGTTRYFEPDLGQKIEKIINQIVDGICRSNNCTFSLDYQYGYPPTINNSEMTLLVSETASKLLGSDRVIRDVNPSMTGEDFGIFLQEVPGCFFWLGTKNIEKGVIYPLHSSLFQLDEDILPLGAALMANIALKFLNHDRIELVHEKENN